MLFISVWIGSTGDDRSSLNLLYDLAAGIGGTCDCFLARPEVGSIDSSVSSSIPLASNQACDILSSKYWDCKNIFPYADIVRSRPALPRHWYRTEVLRIGEIPHCVTVWIHLTSIPMPMASVPIRILVAPFRKAAKYVFRVSASSSPLKIQISSLPRGRRRFGS